MVMLWVGVTNSSSLCSQAKVPGAALSTDCSTQVLNFAVKHPAPSNCSTSSQELLPCGCLEEIDFIPSAAWAFKFYLTPYPRCTLSTAAVPPWLFLNRRNSSHVSTLVCCLTSKLGVTYSLPLHSVVLTPVPCALHYLLRTPTVYCIILLSITNN